MSRNHERIRVMTRRTMILVIVLLQNFIPFLGNIPIGPLSITTMTITVAVVGILFGPVDGMLAGLEWGLITWIRAYVYPSSPLAPLVFVNPLISVLPRLLCGLIGAWLFKLINRFGKRGLASAVAGMGTAISNTVLVMLGIYLFENTKAVAKYYHVTNGHLGTALAAVVGTNGVAEMLMAAIIVPLIAVPLMKVLKK